MSVVPDMAVMGGVSFIVGALAFTGVFSWLAARFDYPRILDGDAATVLPRLRAGGAPMRAVWAIYSLLPLLLVPGAVGALAALGGTPLMTLALVLNAVGALAMCLGLMRWPSIHWVLAESWESAGTDARHSIAATFRGLNLYLGNYIGEFLGEICLAKFFALCGVAMLADARFPAWLGIAGLAFGIAFAIGAFRNVTTRVQWLADINNWLLPLWMILLGGALIRSGVPHP
ncbi:MAG TPA: DUF4386 family protein [Steroidobacteraceae bacterium]|nr:DUF4386 family protein [Steroidobacteraceae bacterium]